MGELNFCGVNSSYFFHSLVCFCFQMSMRNPNVDFTGSARSSIPGNTPRKLEILQCSPPSQKMIPKPKQSPSQTTKQSPTRMMTQLQTPQVPQPQRIIIPSQQLQAHQQAHQQQLQKHQQQFQQIQHQQQYQKQSIVLVPTVQPMSSLSLSTPPVSSGTEALNSSGSTSHINIQPLSISPGSNISLVTSLPTTAPFYLSSSTSVTPQLSQLILTTPAASTPAKTFPSPFKNIKKYPGKVKKGRLDSRWNKIF